jgi:uncharacterized membrane protein
MPGAPVITTGTALAAIGMAIAFGVFVLVAGVCLVIRHTGALPRTRDAMVIMMTVAGTVLAFMTVMWPDVPADPVLVTPTTYGPPPDPLAGFDQSEVP